MLAWEDRKAFIYICANDEAAQMKAQQMLINKGYLWGTVDTGKIDESCIFPDKFVAYFADREDYHITYHALNDLQPIIDYAKSYNCKLEFIGIFGLGLMETE